MSTSDPLEPFHPAVAHWFRTRFAHGPSEPQQAGWPAIARGEDTLIAAPTGTGKTLAAFLVTIDRFYQVHGERQPGLDPGEEPSTRVVYVSPLKALAVDIHHNLLGPLAEIAEVARALGHEPPAIEVAVRSGDTTPAERARIVKRPPDILVTTPESLYLMVTAERSREVLRGVQTVIVDEIHALARDKRGAHLCLTLERLAHVAQTRPVRIGLSATQRPIETVARLLVGAGAGREHDDGRPRCTIVDVGHRRALDVAIELPQGELEAVAPLEQVGEVMDAIAKQVAARQTTLVFVNTRRLAERVAHLLADRLGEGQVAAHHGSLSKERRKRVEQRLRDGDLKVLVATASLELGIDIGPVELVCQIGSPRSIATALQRIGRAGHQRFATPVGRLYPLTRDELVECTALLIAIEAGRLDALVPSRAPLDILAQQIVAECAAEEWDEDALFVLVTRAAPYAELARADFDEIVALVSEGVVTGRGKRAAYVQRDRVNGRLRARRGARLAALTSGGAIPDSADYRVVADPDDTFVGTVNEDFAIESMAGDVFLLGSTSWRIRRVEPGVVRVVDADGATPTIPFWLGEAPARTVELSEEVAKLRAGVERQSCHADAVALLRERAAVGELVATAVVEYLSAGRNALGCLPTQTDIVFERFFDETGGMQLIVHAPFGGRINRALGLLLRKRFCTSFDFELQAAANDDAIVLSLGPQHSFPLEEIPRFLGPAGTHGALLQAVLPTPMFQVRWRWNLNRALLVLRFRKGSRNPPPIQRMEADDLMVAIFPSLAACQDNATGPREIPDHPIVRQTLSDCFTEAMDETGLVALLERIQQGDVRVHYRDTTDPSVLAHEILSSRPYTFLDDAPLEERRTRAVQLRRGLPLDGSELAKLDPAAIARVRAEAAPTIRDPSELHDLLMSLGVTPPLHAQQAAFDKLVQQGRALIADLPTATFEGTSVWLAIEQRPALASAFPDARFLPDRHPPPEAARDPDPERFAADVLMGHLDVLGPTTLPRIGLLTGLTQATLSNALARLEGLGLAMRGRFDPDIDTQEGEQVCARRLLARVHSYTQARLRREIEPVTAQDYMRFLLRYQHVAQDTQLAGQRGVASVVAQLQGFEAAVSTWEPHILSARVHGYRSEWLDAVCLSGEVTWGRLRIRHAAESLRGQALSRAAPVTFAIREDLPWLLPASRTGAELPDVMGHTAQVAACLRAGGALFFDELVQQTGLLPSQVQDALWDGVARGLVTADGFAAARALSAFQGRTRSPFARRRGLRRGARAPGKSQGRWALLPSTLALTSGEVDRDELAEAVAEQLLARWGVVFRDVLARESLALPFRDIMWALRRLEARGIVRGGRFVTGFVGEQYALPSAIEALRATRRRERDGELVRLNACDPLNLVGIILPGARVPAVRTNTVLLRDGIPVAGEVPQPQNQTHSH
ncbi:MAG: DEAD/DEAH box helicase [Myxococcales bacterium]|nr:DEAD/DEAH box helicase [Myxococcales bacterium]